MVSHESHNEQDESTKQIKQKSRPAVAITMIIGLLIALAFGMVASISLGAADIDFLTVWTSIFSFDPDLPSHQIIQELRLPRSIAAGLVGAFLAVSGAIMQGMTRNPLGDPSIMGVTNGAGFAIAIAFAFFPGLSNINMMVFSFLGAGLGASLVFAVGSMSKGGLTPVKLALAGAAVGALLTSLSTAIAIHYHVAKDISFWFAGGVANTPWTSVGLLCIVGAIGFPIALLVARSITILSLGEDVSKGLGQRNFFIKVICILVVLLLTGASVAVAGFIGFIGLVIPHVTRALVGVDYRWIIPCSALLGALLLLLSDIGARLVNAPFETPVGAVTAILGAPFFLYLARREGRGL
ncbi:iron ABC transporter permease [Brevibacillus laterosporus]|uniref:Iron ABC transporter permease n=1 Tax=Brevibacillus laterosporus TaxID=1465 RepID=A0A518VB04_BRELA|nr:iron ABC transporter permease [Brevibacillus laterosporus]QDX94159.1 iron ABC transporter permease [Brevibacillus laterosporus]TPG68093.1 iron ABC transporter permease [Brevibacillus laterosporus]